MINVGSDFSGVGALDQALLAMNSIVRKMFIILLQKLNIK